MEDGTSTKLHAAMLKLNYLYAIKRIQKAKLSMPIVFCNVVSLCVLNKHQSTLVAYIKKTVIQKYIKFDKCKNTI